jgi:hypothetical protein
MCSTKELALNTYHEAGPARLLSAPLPSARILSCCLPRYLQLCPKLRSLTVSYKVVKLAVNSHSLQTRLGSGGTSKEVHMWPRGAAEMT